MESNEARWLQVLDHEQPSSVLPEPWMVGEDSSVVNEAARLLKKLLVVRILRPDRTCSLAEALAVKVLGSEVAEHPQVDLAEFVSERFRPSNPLLMVSAPGYDASYKVEILAK
jgi:dynein heavy chain 1